MLAGATKGDIAFIIGIKNYDNAEAVKWAINDLDRVYEYLVAMGFDKENIKKFPDATQMTFNKIFGAGGGSGQLQDFVEANTSSDGEKPNVFIYYVGHGVADKNSQATFFVAKDSEPNNISVTGFSVARFYKSIDKLPAKRVMVVIDACYSGQTATKGSLLTGVSPGMLKVKEAAPPEKVAVFTSAGSDQVSSWYDDKRHSMFTYYFLKGLLGEADLNKDRSVSYKELEDYVHDNVRRTSMRQSGVKQDPSLSWNRKGENVVIFSPTGPNRMDSTVTNAYNEIKQAVAPGDNATAPAVAAANNTPPTITITSSDISRGIKITARNSRTNVAGNAASESGIAEVTVNGQLAALDASGNFSAEVLLKVGENSIVVTAMDVNRNKAYKTFALVREAGQVTKPATSTAPKPQAAPGGAYHALIIGNNDYQNLDRLKTAVNDAREVELTLKERYGFRTRLLFNATRKEIHSAFNDLRKQVKEQDSVLIYYAGHGVFETEKSYWLPVDAQPDDPTEWIIADTITTSIKRLPSKHVLIVSDSCYSGTLTRSAQTHLGPGERDEFLKKMTARPSRTLMASGGNEPVADSGGSGHSIFADSFLKALQEIDQPVFAADELFFRHIKSRVAGKSDQVPQYNEIRNSGHDGGDFVFVKKVPRENKSE